MGSLSARHSLMFSVLFDYITVDLFFFRFIASWPESRFILYLVAICTGRLISLSISSLSLQVYCSFCRVVSYCLFFILFCALIVFSLIPVVSPSIPSLSIRVPLIFPDSLQCPLWYPSFCNEQDCDEESVAAVRDHIGWLVGWFVGWLVGWLVGCVACSFGMVRKEVGKDGWLVAY